MFDHKVQNIQMINDNKRCQHYEMTSLHFSKCFDNGHFRRSPCVDHDCKMHSLQHQNSNFTVLTSLVGPYLLNEDDLVSADVATVLVLH